MKKNKKTFVFKYDPNCSPERMFADFKLATEGKLRSVEPNVIRSNNLEVLLTSINNNHWDIFNVLNKKKPESLTELAKLLNRDYGNVWRDVQTLEAMGIVKLKKEGKETRPIVLYDEIVWETRSETHSHSALVEELMKKELSHRILTKPKEIIIRTYDYDWK